MDALEAILSRRSIRKYTSENIAQEQLDRILEAGMAAPSALHEEPWHFVIVRERKTIDEICVFHQHAQMAKQSPLSILVCADRKAAKSREEYIYQDCSAAVQNMMVAAKSLGLGSVWTGVYPNAERMNSFSKLFSLPENIIPFAFVVFGHPDERKEAKTGFDKMRVHMEKW